MKSRQEDIEQQRAKAAPRLSTQADQMLKTEHYRYRLNDNAFKFYKKEKGSVFTANIEDIILSSDNWSLYRGRQDKIQHLVKTPDNENGIIDCHIFVPATGVIVKDFGAIQKIEKKSYYTVEELMTMDRASITLVCKNLNIPVVGRTTKILIKDILDRNNSSIAKRSSQPKKPKVEKKEEQVTTSVLR